MGYVLHQLTAFLEADGDFACGPLNRDFELEYTFYILTCDRFHNIKFSLAKMIRTNTAGRIDSKSITLAS